TVTAEQMVGASATENGVVPSTTIDGQIDDAGRQGGSVDDIVTSTAADDQRVIGALRTADVDLNRKTDDRHRGSRTHHLDGIGAMWAVDDARVGLTVASGPADRPGEIDVNLRHDRLAEIVDGHGVGAAESIDVDSLDVVEIHDD